MTVRRELTQAERDFLSEPRFAVLGTTNANGSPHLTVMWYVLDGDEIMFNTAAGRRKPDNLARDGRASLIVPDGYRFVRVEGTARANDDQAVAQADIRRLALHYYQSEDRVQRSVSATWAKQHRITYRMPVRRVYSSGL
ncbi:MAG TPA: PPOX class F420-dependent oxidoreductase [Candidatus Limnocylindria bacterium]|nr:PPOX class F420-dependent oxidoreductase [Candidatus Limnocylindria bacterium]